LSGEERPKAEALGYLDAKAAETNAVADVPDKGDVDDLTREFIAESVEGLDRMERCLTELEVRPDDGELLADIFCTVHTIKGTTGFLGFARLEKSTHAGENLLGALRDVRLAVCEELVGGLLRLLDMLRSILRLIETTGGEGHRACDDDSELIALLVELNSDPQGIESCIELNAEPTALEALDRSAGVVAGVEMHESVQGMGRSRGGRWRRRRMGWSMEEMSGRYGLGWMC
jgi:chemotaxis protein histidine kinase CheA